MTDEFNLLDEPWIPVRPLGIASIRDVSLLDAVLNAHQFAEIVHPSPIVTLVLHRFVIAFLYSAFRGPDRLSALERILDRGSFDETVVRQYAAKWRHRFFLFGDAPILQDPLLAEELRADKEQPLPAEQLRRETALPNGKTLFDHTLPGSPSLALAEATRYLIAYQFFGLRDGRGYERSPVSTGIATYVRGHSLFQTLALNLLPYNTNSPIPGTVLTDDAPTWEVKELPDIPPGWLAYLTRPYRRALLVGDLSGGVFGVYRKAGPGLDNQWRASLRDPWLTYVTRKTGPRAVSLDGRRALWRDSEVLLRALVDRGPDDAKYKRILARIGTHAAVEAVGVLASDASISMWRRESLPVATESFGEGALSVLGQALQAAEDAGYAVRRGCDELGRFVLIPNWDRLAPKDQSKQWQALTKRPGPRKRSRLDHFVDSLAPLTTYWPALDVPFRTYMLQLAADYESDFGEAADAWWVGQVSRAARDAFEQACRDLETESRGYRAAAGARPRFRYLLGEALKPLQPEQSMEPTPELEEVSP